MTRRHLNRKLTLETMIRTDDGAGGFIESWQDLGTLWGDVSSRKGRYVTGQGGAMSQMAFQIVLRGAPVGHSNRPRPGQKLRMGTRVFRIHAVTEEEPSGMYLICETEEEVAV